MMLLVLSIIASLIAVAGCVYLVAAAMLVGRSARKRTRPHADAMPGVTILKPLYGNEPALLANLASFCAQDYPGRLQVVFGLQDPSDAGVAVVRELQNCQATRDLDLVIETKLHGMNRKISNLVNMTPRIRHEVIVVADSDMRVGPDYLSQVIAALEERGVGAVTCLYYGVPVSGMWAGLSALAINAHFLPGVVFGIALGLARPCFGSTLALRRQTLSEIGDFMPFVDCLADDYAMGEALRARGCRISIPPFAIAHICAERSLGELWQQELRWARTIRNIDPVGYAGSIVAHPLAWAMLATVIGTNTATFLPAIAVAIASIGCRMALLWRVERAYTLPSQAYWLVPARDLLSFILFLVSFLGWDVNWKGNRYRIAAGGNLATDRDSSTP